MGDRLRRHAQEKEEEEEVEEKSDGVFSPSLFDDYFQKSGGGAELQGRKSVDPSARFEGNR